MEGTASRPSARRDCASSCASPASSASTLPPTAAALPTPGPPAATRASALATLRSSSACTETLDGWQICGLTFLVLLPPESLARVLVS